MDRGFKIISRIALLALNSILIIAPVGYAQDACTDIIVGKNASADGSVITSHTECCPDCRVFVVPAQTFKKGDKAPVYYRWCDAKRPLGDFGDNLLHMKWQEAIKDLKAVRDPLETRFFADQPAIEERALELYKKDPDSVKNFLTDYTIRNMDDVMKMYKELRHLLITKYTNNREFF